MRPPGNASVSYSRAVSLAESLERLRAAADDGRLDDVARRHGVALITVFGSAVRTPERATTSTSPCPFPQGRTGCWRRQGNTPT